MAMSLDDMDAFLGWNKPAGKGMKISVDTYTNFIQDLLTAAGFNTKTSPTIVSITIRPWSLEVVLPADKNDEDAYPCDEHKECWLRSVEIEIDNTGA